MSEKALALESVSLSIGETVFATGYVSYEVIRHIWKKGLLSTEKFIEKEQIIGYVSFTNYRLIFIEKRGFLNHSFHCKLSLDYERISGISSGGWATKYISVSDENGMEYRFKFSGLDENKIENIKATIRKFIADKKTYLEQKERAKRIQVTVDFSFLRSIAEKGGIVLTTVACPYCGGTLELPKSGNISKCLHCGKQVYATDVFEKMKGVLSGVYWTSRVSNRIHLDAMSTGTAPIFGKG